ncbi:hypothetical protein ES703_19462 [subsurface metagenome]
MAFESPRYSGLEINLKMSDNRGVLPDWKYITRESKQTEHSIRKEENFE